MNLCPIRARRKIVNALDAVHQLVKAKQRDAAPKVRAARSGEGGRAYAQGGNLPFYRRLPFIRGEGFTPPNQVTYNEVNLDQLSEAFKANADVNLESLTAADLLRDSRDPVVVLGRGDLKVASK